MKEKFKRFIALFLILTITLSVQNLKVSAETISENEVVNEGIEENNHDKQTINPLEEKTVSGEYVGEEVFSETDAAGKESFHVGINQEGTPSNPIHHCAPDYTDFSYVYFGSYPQSEVTDSAIIADIENAISTSETEADADVGIDVWVDGIKYRRISKSDTNYSGYFGNSQYRYFKWEKIRWKVLQNDGASLFVMADMALDCKDYHDAGGEITWEDSSIRSWLNGSFYNTAFNSREQEVIVEQTVVNDDNPTDGTEGGNDTRDKVYLLSIDEVTKEIYGFCNFSNTCSQSRRMKASDYANARGTSGRDGNCGWWLRSPGRVSNSAASVYDSGWVDRDGDTVHTRSGGVCPALHINLQFGIRSMLDDSTVGENVIQTEGEVPTNPVHHCPAKEGITDCTDWNYAYFGSYPQSEVKDSAIIAAIENAISISGTEVNADVGIDVWVDGVKYRRISESDTNYSGYFGNSQYRYFKWEKLKWKVLQNDGSTLFVAADKAIDCKNYNDESINTTWETSTIRNWLNNSFYGTAFSSSEQNAIVAQNVVNEDNPDYGTEYGAEGGNNTNDKIYLLSIGEVENETYGFYSDYSTNSASRWVQPSNYARARGTYTYNSSYTGENDNCWWWLRSPGSGSHCAAYVDNCGYVSRNGSDVHSDYGSVGVCPALHINLSSDLWLAEDDGTSGEGGSYRENTLMGLQASKKKTEYMQGENLNLDDLTVTAVYENSTKVLPADSYTTNASAIDMNTPGSKTLTISYTEGAITKTTAITITVNQKANISSPAKKGTKITDKVSTATYKVTSTDSETPTVEYNGTTNQKKKTITIPEYVTYQGVKYKVTSVSAKSFKGNKKLTTIKIASSITKIGDSAFEGCTSLKTVTIGTGLKTIGKNAFKNCKNLKTLTIKSSKLKTVGKNAFKNIYAKCKIKVPAKKVKAYTKLMKKKGQKSTVKITK
ncbi:MAG: DUF6273 domain-containing protein [Roseburia sp.]|nr:DUF6273 domain-containing protein [Roseburia sp.]MCM1278562.1 DUF6273 domain-containing protein [Robinsoniella sp.]